jgi:outer membrane protein assembly factor BamA
VKRLLQSKAAIAVALVLLPTLLATGPARCGAEQADPGHPTTAEGPNGTPAVAGLSGGPEHSSATNRPGGTPTAASPASRALVLEKIVITGNRHLDERVILDAIRLEPGDTVTVAVLEQARLQLLEASSIINEVNLFTRPGSVRGALILEIDLVERKAFSLETGYGYHDVNGWFLTLIGLRFDPLYRTDSRLRLGLRFGFNLISLDGEWENPPPVQGGLGWGTRFYVRTEERRFFGNGTPEYPEVPALGGYTWSGPEWTEFRHEISRAGGEVAGLYRHGDARFSFGARVESAEPESTFLDVERDVAGLKEDFPPDLAQDIEETLITGLFFRMTRDTRDHVIYPRSGSFALLSLEANNTFLGGDKTFSRVVLDYRHLADLGGSRVLSGRLNAGITSSGTPYYERFTLGGIYSIRGFRELSLSPTAGYDGFWMGSCELRFPLLGSAPEPPRLCGLVFFDVGQGWQRGEALSSRDLHSAVGYGVRLRLPWLGMLGVDAGIPFSLGRTDERFRIHGSLGFSF